MKKGVIITAVDQKYGRFLIDHWLKSLIDNTNLEDIDIVVLDYGLLESQVKEIKAKGVIVEKVRKSGHIVNTRYDAAARFLEKNLYDQVLLVDGGDIIFQKDISRLFNEHEDLFRAVPHLHQGIFYELFIPKSFAFKDWMKIYWFVRKRPMYNGGFILGPRTKIIEIADKMAKLIHNRGAYGADQIAFNYLVHEYGIVPLDLTYNHSIFTGDEEVVIKEGRVYDKNNDLIAVVHNSGKASYMRALANFGYGHNYNSENWFSFAFRKILFFFIRIIKPFSP